jgi:hypothetical protein
MSVPPRYQEWIAHVFDHPVSEPEWYWSLSPFEPLFSGGTAIVDLIAYTFERCGEDLAAFSDAQIDQGLRYLLTSPFDFFYPIRDSNAPLANKRHAIASIYQLYSHCFSRRCAEVTGHNGEAGGATLNHICYMFWDICPLSYLEKAKHAAELADSIFAVLDRILQIEHRACREGALHGLGEMACWYGPRVAQMVDQFLASTVVDAELRRYALLARNGAVL